MIWIPWYGTRRSGTIPEQGGTMKNQILGYIVFAMLGAGFAWALMQEDPIRASLSVEAR